MTLTTYPLDDYDYSADDAALFHCTRTSGIYAGEDFAFSVSGADNIIKISPGLAWMRINRFKGLVAALKNETSIDLGLPDSIYPRIDRVVLQFSANKNGTEVVAKKGVAASNPLPPERSTSEALFELHLLEVRREPGSVSITAEDITDLRLDESCCGLMAESVTNVDTKAINEQVTALVNELRAKLGEVEEQTYFASKEYVKTTAVQVTLPAAGWVGDSAPYTQTVTVAALTDERRAMVYPEYGNDTEANLAMRDACACVSYAKRDGQNLTFTCLDDKPEVDVRVIVEVYV